MDPLVIAIKMLGDVAVPLLLFSLGVRMTNVSFSEWKVATGSAVLRPGGYVDCCRGNQAARSNWARCSDVTGFGALPPAVLNFLFAERYQQEPERVASIVLIGNLAALVFLPLALAGVIARQIGGFDDDYVWLVGHVNQQQDRLAACGYPVAVLGGNAFGAFFVE